MKTALLTILILASVPVRAQFTGWDMVTGSTGDDAIRATVPVPEGGCLAAGYILSSGTGNDGWLIRIDAAGDTLWTRTYGGAGHEAFYAACATADGYLLAGYTTTGTGGSLYPWFVRIDAAGDTLWTARHHDYDVTTVHAIAALPDGFIAAGTVTRGAGYGKDGWTVKLRPDGSRAWSGTYGGAADDKLTAAAAAGTGCILAGITASSGRGGTDAWLVRLQNNGDTAWTRTYGGTEYDGANTVVADADGFAFAGYRELSGAFNMDGWLYRVGPDGDSISASTYGGSGSDMAYGLTAAPGGGYALCGATASSGAGLYDAWLAVTGTDGSLIRSVTFGGTDHDRAYALCPAAGGGYVLAGESRSGAAGGYDAYVVGVDAAVNPVARPDAGQLPFAAECPSFLSAPKTAGTALLRLDGTLLHGRVRPGCYLVRKNGRGDMPAAVIVR